MSWTLIQGVNLPSPISSWDRCQHLPGSKAPHLMSKAPVTLVRKTVQTASEDNVNIKKSVIGWVFIGLALAPQNFCYDAAWGQTGSPHCLLQTNTGYARNVSVANCQYTGEPACNKSASMLIMLWLFTRAWFPEKVSSTGVLTVC